LPFHFSQLPILLPLPRFFSSSPSFFPLFSVEILADRGLEPPPPHQLTLSLTSFCFPKLLVLADVVSLRKGRCILYWRLT
jgi:hypothetical protein